MSALVGWFMCTSIFLSNAQKVEDTLVSIEPQIVALSRPQKDGKIMLRWAPTTAKSWRKLNEFGYDVRRYTVTRNKTTLPQPEEKIIGVFKPQPLEEWRTIVENNDNAAVVAQSLYGESFDIEGMDKLEAIVNLAEEQEQRFSWGLYAADQDFEAAVMAGLGYIDTDINENEKYVYKITSLVPENIISIKDGGVFVGLQDYEELPKPLDLAGVFNDEKALLSWNYAIHNQLYNSYYVERSEDGNLFKSINDLPLTSLNNSDRTNSKRMFYIDSIQNGKTYYYRVKGKTPFGELSPASEVVSGKGEKLLAYVPHITTKNYLDEKSIILEWEFLEEGNKEIKGFELNRSDKANGNYKVVMRNIPPEARKIKYDSLLPTNYLTLTALGKNGSNRTSFPVLIQPVDSVPPVKPKGLKGVIDTLGIVTLDWEANKDADILGYRVFRGNNKKEEFSQLTISPHQGIKYFDSISVQSLNSKVYYQIYAVDQRYNMSEASDVLELKKPDFSKPTQPVIKSYSIEEGKVELLWANSSSEDVVKHEVYRRSEEKEEWQMVYVLEKQEEDDKNQVIDSLFTQNQFKPSKWTDDTVEEGKLYNYTVIAVDETNLESDPAPPLTVDIPKTTLYPPVERLDSYVDKNNGYIEVFWKPYKYDNVQELAIYKGVKDKKMSLLKNVLPNVRRITDNQVKPNNEYVYLIRAIYSDGHVSETAKLEVKY